MLANLLLSSIISQKNRIDLGNSIGNITGDEQSTELSENSAAFSCSRAKTIFQLSERAVQDCSTQISDKSNEE